MKIYRATAFAAQIGVHKSMVKAWSLKGKLPHCRTPAKNPYYTEVDVEQHFGVEPAPEIQQTVVYCRVSRRSQQACHRRRSWSKI